MPGHSFPLHVLCFVSTTLEDMLFLCRVWRANPNFASYKYQEINKASKGAVQALLSNPLAKSKTSDRGDWVACEKVHGSNFGVVLETENGKDIVKFSKRSGFLRTNEDFFGYQCLIPEFDKQIHQTRSTLEEHLGNKIEAVLLNGELFGGKYDHPAVKPERQACLVEGREIVANPPQKDDFPQYTPRLSFYAFDLKFKLRSDDPSWTMCTFDQASDVFRKVDGLVYSKPLRRGDLEDVIALPEEFQTTIPALLGLGDYPLENNWAEGYVVRHVLHGTPGFQSGQVSTMLKVKAVFFQELRHKDQEFKRELEDVRKLLQLVLPDPEAVLAKSDFDFWLAVKNRISQSRIQGLVSKLGPDPIRNGEISFKDFSRRLAGDALKDALKEVATAEQANTSIAARRTIAQYCEFESRVVVAQFWKGLITRGEVTAK